MSFYNVTNPTTFQVLDLIGRQGTFKQSALQRADSTQIFSANATLTAQQVIAGVLFVDTTSAVTLTLPSAAVLLAALNSGVYASSPVSLNDIIYITVVAYGSGTNSAFIASGSTASTAEILFRRSEQVGIRFTNVTAGSEAYSVLN
jgi:hypothetical protein